MHVRCMSSLAIPRVRVEVQQVKPIVDAYSRQLVEEARDRGVEIFYDHERIGDRCLSDEQLGQLLADALARTDLFVAFISPRYVGTTWSRFEWECGPSRDGQPMRVHPIYWKRDYEYPELQSGDDRRPPRLRPEDLV